MIIFFLQKSTSSSSSIAFFFLKKPEINFKEEKEKSILSCHHPLLLEKKKGLRYLIIEHKKLITISGIASWRNFFAFDCFWNEKKAGEILEKKLREIEKISWIKK